MVKSLLVIFFVCLVFQAPTKKNGNDPVVLQTDIQRKAAIDGEQLGAGNVAAMLVISLSTPDYIVLTFGPNSGEAEDAFFRLDKHLGAFLDFLDEKVRRLMYDLNDLKAPV